MKHKKAVIATCVSTFALLVCACTPQPLPEVFNDTVQVEPEAVIMTEFKPVKFTDKDTLPMQKASLEDNKEPIDETVPEETIPEETVNPEPIPEETVESDDIPEEVPEPTVQPTNPPAQQPQQNPQPPQQTPQPPAQQKPANSTPPSSMCGAPYAGTFSIPAFGLSVPCYSSISQDVVDAANSAAYFHLQNHLIIADHVNQNFYKIKSCYAGVKAYMGGVEYECVTVMQGRNDGHRLTANGQDISEIYPGTLVAYTCNSNWQSVTIVFFKRAGSDVNETPEEYEDDSAIYHDYTNGKVPCPTGQHDWILDDEFNYWKADENGGDPILTRQSIYICTKCGSEWYKHTPVVEEEPPEEPGEPENTEPIEPEDVIKPEDTIEPENKPEDVIPEDKPEDIDPPEDPVVDPTEDPVIEPEDVVIPPDEPTEEPSDTPVDEPVVEPLPEETLPEPTEPPAEPPQPPIETEPTVETEPPTEAPEAPEENSEQETTETIE